MPGAHFEAPLVIDNRDGWGPTDDTFQYKDMPYQPYSKSDQLGKVRPMINIDFSNFHLYNLGR